MNNEDKRFSDENSELQDLKNQNDSLKKAYEAEIDGLKKALEDVRKSEERFRIAYKTSPDSININRLSDGMYVSVNEGFTNILGYSESETIGRTSIEMNIWANPADRAHVVQEVLKNGSVKSYECQFLAKNGNIVTALISASLIELDGIDHLLTVTRDITIRKKAEEALAEEQFLISALMNNITDHVYFKDLQSKFIRTSRAHALSFGLSDPQQVIGKTDFDFFAEDDAQRAYDDEQLIIKTGQPIRKEERLMRKDRSDVWFSAIKMPLQDSSGKTIGTFGISRDITTRKRAEFESYALFEITRGITTTDNLDELLKLIHTSLGKVVYAENCFIALFDETTELFSFPYFVDMIDTTPTTTSMAKSCSAYVFKSVKPLLLSQEKFDELEKQGEVALVGSNSPSWIGIPLQTPSRVIGVLVLQHYEKENVYSENDVKFLVSIGSQIALAIERKKREEEISQKNEQLQLINAEKDKFFSILAHDLKGPLSAFVGATQILAEEFRTMEIDEITNLSLSMKTSALNIYSLLENLLEWSRLKRKGIDIVREKINLRSEVNSCINLLHEQARKKNIDISVFIDDAMEVFSDKHMLDTIMRNLISNAIKFTHLGGKVTVSAITKDEHIVEVRVVDTGIGMNAELKNKLFLINEKTSRTGTSGELSSGLGLLLCKEFIENCGGEIGVESEPGLGSTFYFTIVRS
jgi:PAS domain S-box-containing protein